MSRDHNRTSFQCSRCGYRWDPGVSATVICPVCGALPGEGAPPPIIKLKGAGKRLVVFAALPFICLFSLCLLITPFFRHSQNATPFVSVTSVVRAAVTEEADLHKSRPVSSSVTPLSAALTDTASRLPVQPAVSDTKASSNIDK